MEKLILADGTEIEITEGASIGNITVGLADYAALEILAGKLSKEKLINVQFKSDDVVTGEYTDMLLCEPNFHITQKPGYLQVSFGIREKTAEELRQDNMMIALSYLTDEEAATVTSLHPEWQAGVAYKIGIRRLFNDNLYRCKQDHTSEAQYTPDQIPALWDLIHPENYGTIDNPVIVPEQVSSMVYIKGKYYQEDTTLYLMNREGMKDGEEISLTFKPSQLVDQYFKVVNKA